MNDAKLYQTPRHSSYICVWARKLCLFAVEGGKIVPICGWVGKIRLICRKRVKIVLICGWVG